MTRYSTTTVAVLCMFSFFAGRMLQLGPGLPEGGDGVSACGALRSDSSSAFCRVQQGHSQPWGWMALGSLVLRVAVAHLNGRPSATIGWLQVRVLSSGRKHLSTPPQEPFPPLFVRNQVSAWCTARCSWSNSSSSSRRAGWWCGRRMGRQRGVDSSPYRRKGARAARSMQQLPRAFNRACMRRLRRQ
jgi:hypothetical protein